MASENLAEQYNGKAEQYMEAQDRFYAEREDNSRKALYSLFDFDVKGKRILDAGCGFGRDAAHFHDLGALVYGIDASEEMVRLAKERYPELKNLSVQSFEKTGFPDKFFDVVYSRYALHYSENLGQVYEEFSRILKPKGHLIFLAAHPLLGFIAKKEKNYHKSEITEVPIYDGSFTVKAPTHTFSDYLNGTLLKHFDLLHFEEQSPENKSNETNFKEIIPEYLMLKLRKRILK